jgi:hypothetical protein
MTTANANMQYTSSVNIPIWNYTKLQKIVVYGAHNNSTFVLFNKTRTMNPIILEQTKTINLHYELFEYEKTADIEITPRYGQSYKPMKYIRIINAKWETEWEPWTVKTFYVEYIYDDLGYDISLYKTNNVPLQFIFKEYNFSTTDIQQYKTLGYTASELKAAGIKFSALLGGGYSMDVLFSVLWNLYTDNPNDFITYFNSMKTGDPAINAENASLKTAILSLTAENTSLKTVYLLLETTDTENTLLQTENTSLKTENALLKPENALLKNNIESLESEITLLKTEISNNTTNIATQCSLQICKWETLSKT